MLNLLGGFHTLHKESDVRFNMFRSANQSNRYNALRQPLQTVSSEASVITAFLKRTVVHPVCVVQNEAR